jgi:hypothetical protein
MLFVYGFVANSGQKCLPHLSVYEWTEVFKNSRIGLVHADKVARPQPQTNKNRSVLKQ